MTNPNEPINPIESVPRMEITYGLTKREYFAAMALQGLIAGAGSLDAIPLCNSAVFIANKLIKTLNEDNSDRI